MAAREIFNWPVDLDGTSATVTYNVRTVQFGDGYEQRQATSLRRKKHEWAVTKTGKNLLIDEIVAFLDEHMGLAPFLWRRTGEYDLLVKVDSYTKTPKGGGVWTLSFTMKEVLA